VSRAQTAPIWRQAAANDDYSPEYVVLGHAAVRLRDARTLLDSLRVDLVEAQQQHHKARLCRTQRALRGLSGAEPSSALVDHLRGVISCAEAALMRAESAHSRALHSWRLVVEVAS
jgi:hypothetical protein